MKNHSKKRKSEKLFLKKEIHIKTKNPSKKEENERSQKMVDKRNKHQNEAFINKKY
jgi:hypothetical protein